MESLGDRMKKYEAVSKNKLVSRMPVVLRIDGKAFHTFSRGFIKPYDEVMGEAMKDTMKFLCQNIQGAVLGYTQSDEITLILVDYKNINSSAWFDNEVQKIASIAASMATLAFNKAFTDKVLNWMRVPRKNLDNARLQKMVKTLSAYKSAVSKGATFDCRCFNVPKEDVTNCILWRQNDATRNSIAALGRVYFSQKQLYGKNSDEVQDMLYQGFGINWNDCPTTVKRGCCCIKNESGKWLIDNEIPIFKGEGRNYIEKLINFE